MDPEKKISLRASRERRNGTVSVKALLARLMPQQNERMERLESVLRSWARVVGPALARQSAPYDLEGTRLSVAAASPHAAQQMLLRKGNIVSALSRHFGLTVEEVRVTVGPPPVRPSSAKNAPRRRHPPVKVPQAEVEERLRSCPASLTPEAALALARLRVFFERRFRGRGTSGRE